jgi:hypothetical protein
LREGSFSRLLQAYALQGRGLHRPRCFSVPEGVDISRWCNHRVGAITTHAPWWGAGPVGRFHRIDGMDFGGSSRALPGRAETQVVRSR